MLLVKLNVLKSLNKTMLTIKKMNALKNKAEKMFFSALLLFTPLVFAEESTPVVGKHSGANMDAMSMIVSLLLVLGLIVVCALLVKRFQPMIQMNSALKVVSSLSLGAKERIVVVQVGDKQLLLGVTSQQISLLESLESPLQKETSPSSDINSSLRSLFKKS
jgi:flagellar protein FliO/FliZ